MLINNIFFVIFYFLVGRRDNVSLLKILKFVIGSEIEFVLGYVIDFCIEFDKYVLLVLLMSNICINKFILVIGDNLFFDWSDIYDFFDYVFISDYFGII